MFGFDCGSKLCAKTFYYLRHFTRLISFIIIGYLEHLAISIRSGVPIVIVSYSECFWWSEMHFEMDDGQHSSILRWLVRPKSGLNSPHSFVWLIDWLIDHLGWVIECSYEPFNELIFMHYHCIYATIMVLTPSYTLCFWQTEEVSMKNELN